MIKAKVNEYTIRKALIEQRKGNERGYELLISEAVQDLKFYYNTGDVEIYGLINEAKQKILKG